MGCCPSPLFLCSRSRECPPQTALLLMSGSYFAGTQAKTSTTSEPTAPFSQEIYGRHNEENNSCPCLRCKLKKNWGDNQHFENNPFYFQRQVSLTSLWLSFILCAFTFLNFCSANCTRRCMSSSTMFWGSPLFASWVGGRKTRRRAVCGKRKTSPIAHGSEASDITCQTSSQHGEINSLSFLSTTTIIKVINSFPPPHVFCQWFWIRQTFYNPSLLSTHFPTPAPTLCHFFLPHLYLILPQFCGLLSLDLHRLKF